MSNPGSRATSPIDGFGTVKNVLKGFTEPDKETSLSSDDIDQFIDNLSNPKEMVKYYQNEMEQLQKEIESLEDHLEADKQRILQIPSNVLEEIGSKLQGSSASGIGGDEELQTILKQIQEGEAIPKILSQQETKSVITKLKALVDEQVRIELNDTVQEIENTCALEPFLNGYGQYAEWFRCRERTLTHFKNQHPTAVTLPQGSTGALLQFSHPDNNGAVFMVSWAIPFNLTGRTEPSIDLHVKASTHMNQLDKRNVLKTAPEEFQKMLTSLGVEKAIDSIIQAVAT